ncbi:MAG: hypothetical protein JOS17DRAFT_666477, partial [Linnemannia elongata]
IANTVEVYSRTKMVDVHWELFFVRKGQPVMTSLPLSMRTPYSHNEVWTDTEMQHLSSSEGDRLIIGTSSFNTLVTSSLPLDTKME